MKDSFNRLKLKIRNAYRALPGPLRAAWISSASVFTGTLFMLATNLLPTLAEAITTQSFDSFLSHLALTTQAAFSAVLAFGAGVVNALYRFWRPVERAYVTDEAVEAEVTALATLRRDLP